MIIQIKSNYNTSLFHIIDYISVWDEHVSNHNYLWFKSRFYISQKDRDMLNKYAKYRKRLGWDSESTLLNWAYNGFRGKRHKKLLSVIEHFEFKRSRNGTTLSYYIRKKQDKIDKNGYIIARKLKTEKYNIKRLLKYSPSKRLLRNMNIFLAPSFDLSSYQAGANGNGILVEIPARIQTRELITIILHELFHKLGNLSYYLNRYPNIEERNLLKRRNSELLYSTKADIIDEIFAYTLTNHMINKEDPKVKIRLYRKIKEKRERNYLVSIWEGVKKLAPKILKLKRDKRNPKYLVNLMVNEYTRAI